MIWIQLLSISTFFLLPPRVGIFPSFFFDFQRYDEFIQREEEFDIHPSRAEENSVFPEARVKNYERWPTLFHDENHYRRLQNHVHRVRDQSELRHWYAWRVSTKVECSRGVPREVFIKWGALCARNIFDESRKFTMSGFVIFPQTINLDQSYTIVVGEQDFYVFQCNQFSRHLTFAKMMNIKSRR